MYTFLKELLNTKQAKIPTLDNSSNEKYKLGLLLLASIVREEFIDISVLPENRFSSDGLFYSIPYFDDDTLWHNGHSWLLQVTW